MFGAEAVVRALGSEYIGGVLLPYEMITCTAANPNPEAEDHEGAYQADFGANECYVCRDCGARWGPNE